MATIHRRYKDATFGIFARIAKALASPRRLELLDLLAQAPKTVENLAQATGLSLANASQHLQAMKAARLVESAKEGLYVRYRISDPKVIEVYLSFHALAETLDSEIKEVTARYLQGREDMEPIDPSELKKRLKSGSAVLIDVRPEDEFEAGHLPGAVNFPLHLLPSRISELPKGREVVAYCRGPYCVQSVKALEILKSKGIRARRLSAGVHQWQRHNAGRK